MKCLMCEEFDAVACGPYQKGDECICARCLEDVDRQLERYGKRLDRQAARIQKLPEASATKVFAGDVLVLRDGGTTERLRGLRDSVDGLERSLGRVGFGVIALLVYAALRIAGFVS